MDMMPVNELVQLPDWVIRLYEVVPPARYVDAGEDR
jgi:hypothetical protein